MQKIYPAKIVPTNPPPPPARSWSQGKKEYEPFPLVWEEGRQGWTGIKGNPYYVNVKKSAVSICRVSS